MTLRTTIYKLMALAATIGTIGTTASPPSSAQIPGYYYCGTHEGHPATMYQSPSGSKLAFISWQTDYFAVSGFSREERCAIVSRKFEQNRQSGNLRNIIPGVAPNGLPVVCASTVAGTGIAQCPDSRILWTLKSKNDYNPAIKRIGELNSGRTRDAQVEDRGVRQRNDGYFVIDVPSMMLDLKPVQSGQNCYTGAIGLLVCN